MHYPHSHYRKPLPSRALFVRTMLRNAGIGAGLIVVSLGIGMAGYHWFVGLGWLDSFLNASMILTGMGPVDPVRSTGGKVFAGCYAIFSGVVFLTMAAVILAPVVHRFLHRMHLDIEEIDSEGQGEGGGRRRP